MTKMNIQQQQQANTCFPLIYCFVQIKSQLQMITQDNKWCVSELHTKQASDESRVRHVCIHKILMRSDSMQSKPSAMIYWTIECCY